MTIDTNWYLNTYDEAEAIVVRNSHDDPETDYRVAEDNGRYRVAVYSSGEFVTYL